MNDPPAATEIKHPIFARLYMRMPADLEAEQRRELLNETSGEVLEVGCGHGLNFGFYPETVTRVVAIEPEPSLRRAAEVAAGTAPVPVEVRPGVAERLPFADGSFDAAVASLMLCSVPDQAAALAEMRRVLKPGGELRFYEHVVSRGRFAATAQKLLDRTVWPHAVGGCHLARDTAAAIRTAGFEVERERRGRGPAPLLAPHILGRARRV